MKTHRISIKIKGLMPMIMHSAVTADPTSKEAKELKKYSSKRSKTDEDYEMMAQIEYKASQYRDTKRFGGTGLYMPTENLMSCLIQAGKKIKHGRGSMKSTVSGIDFNSAIGWPLVMKYKTYEEFEADPETWFKKIVNVQGSKCLRTRVLIPEWSFTAFAELDLEIIDKEMLTELINVAGKRIGLCDWRPSSGSPGTYGKFLGSVEDWEGSDEEWYTDKL